MRTWTYSNNMKNSAFNYLVIIRIESYEALLKAHTKNITAKYLEKQVTILDINLGKLNYKLTFRSYLGRHSITMKVLFTCSLLDLSGSHCSTNPWYCEWVAVVIITRCVYQYKRFWRRKLIVSQRNPIIIIAFINDRTSSFFRQRVNPMNYWISNSLGIIK